MVANMSKRPQELPRTSMWRRIQHRAGKHVSALLGVQATPHRKECVYKFHRLRWPYVSHGGVLPSEASHISSRLQVTAALHDSRAPFEEWPPTTAALATSTTSEITPSQTALPRQSVLHAALRCTSSQRSRKDKKYGLNQMLGWSTQRRSFPLFWNLTLQCGEQLGVRSQANVRVAASSASEWVTKDCKKIQEGFQSLPRMRLTLWW